MPDTSSEADHYAVTHYDGNDFLIARVRVWAHHPDPWKEIKQQLPNAQDIISAIRIHSATRDEAVLMFNQHGERVRV